jgi:hypothetical protein
MVAPGDTLGDDPAISDGIAAVANAINETYLYQDARAFIEDGVLPEDLPSDRDYQWPNPEEWDGETAYREALKQVLEQYYEENGYPEQGGDV